MHGTFFVVTVSRKDTKSLAQPLAQIFLQPGISASALTFQIFKATIFNN